MIRFAILKRCVLIAFICSSMLLIFRRLQFINTKLDHQYISTRGLRLFDICIIRARKNRGIMCPWPPANLEHLRDLHTKLLDLSIRPNYQTNSDSGALERKIWKFSTILTTGENVTGSNLKRIVILDALARKADINSNHDLYPQILDLPSIVSAIRRGASVSEKPLNDLTLTVLSQPRYTCSPVANEKYLDLIVFIKTCSGCYENRMMSRRTYTQQHLWIPFKIAFVFVVGIHKSLPQTSFHFEGVDVPFYAPETSMNISKNFTMSNLINESSFHGDMLVGSFWDTYYNLTKKMIFTFRWAAVVCRNKAPLYMFVDDDQVIIPNNVKRFISRIPNEIKFYFVAGVKLKENVTRPSPDLPFTRSRWVASEDEIPWSVYPPYFQGTCYMLGADVLLDLSIAMAYTKEFRVDDAYLGFVLHKMRKQIYDIKEIDGFAHDNSNLSEVLALSKTKALGKVNWENGNII